MPNSCSRSTILVADLVLPLIFISIHSTVKNLICRTKYGKILKHRWDAGVVERGRLESDCASNGTGGSNPSPTAMIRTP
jgi:hypothetical protein